MLASLGPILSGFWNMEQKVSVFRHFPTKLFVNRMNSIPKETRSRSGTRVPCQIPATLSSLDPSRPYSEPCQIVLVNPQGSAARVGRSVEVGSAVQLEGLAAKNAVTAQVVNCMSLSSFEAIWLLGLALDCPGNVWGIATPPEDWTQ